ncbi:glycine--tRNA ligase subunit beta [Bombilactobacillus thymidiniphilus]|uniref:Glycine--tRNA ligase beta subunit n=1 Tax=Bombilactobacillus thymidiniphilus TaxID=2923363 RepID=A0ABY4PCX3_9LACO|nr:glycine--tRNA ligase subunit beta [Bombilactobacillus thymidiniphilus]UQS83546.1 glycine--tRNA ligase subunit beta [Bombilactobacillus thymidiniphilus]
MTKDFLLELGLEEMPAHVVTDSQNQLTQRVTDYLAENKLTHGQVECFSTPRRLALLIHDVADKQIDEDVEVKGPAQKIAQDEAGEWTKAARGFVRGQGLTTQDIFFKEINGVAYVHVKKHIAGKSATDILAGLKKPITAMTFPTRMKWNKFSFEYIRPLHWIVALLDNKVIDLQILNVKSSNQTFGHRFLGTEITLGQAGDYEAALNNDFVIASCSKRKQVIRQQIAGLATQNNWVVDVDEDLLEEVTNLVEYPTAFAGQFADKYLQIPEEVLITSMKDNQRYFYVRDQTGKLLPYFIGVRNGNHEHLQNVIAGNEKVLVARLEDAAFFFAEDQKHDIDYYVAKLKNVAFHDKIGSMAEKMQRTQVIAQILAAKFTNDTTTQQAISRAAGIYKFDLVTEMVGEFAELQGVMGAKYASIFGEKDVVATGIGEQYLPTSAEGQLPQSLVGKILSLADKLESIMSFFAVGLIPNGSNDPYGLRRQATGIVRILQDNQWHVDLQLLQDEICTAYDNSFENVTLDYHKHQIDVNEFIVDRVRQILSQQQVNHDIIAAVTATTVLDPLRMFQMAAVLQQKQTTDEYKADLEALTRVLRITTKQAPVVSVNVDNSLFQDPSEEQLAQAVQQVASDFYDQDVAQQYEAITSLRVPITEYFAKNMILDKQEDIRNNRLAQLQQITDLVQQLGDFNQLLVK